MVSSTAEIEYIACDSTHGHCLGKRLRLTECTVVAMCHYHHRLACVAVVGNIGIAMYIFPVAGFDIDFFNSERIVDVREVLGLHREVGEVA